MLVLNNLAANYDGIPNYITSESWRKVGVLGAWDNGRRGGESVQACK